MKQHLIDFNNWEYFPSYNRAVIMAGISEKQNDRVFNGLVPISGIKSYAVLDSWTVEKNEDGYPVIHFESGRERDLTSRIIKGENFEPYDIRNQKFKTIIKVSLSGLGKIFRDVVYKAPTKREENSSESKMVNLVYNLVPDSISRFEALICVMERLPYKTTLIYVIPDIAVLKEENSRIRQVYKGGTLREGVRKSIETLFQLKERPDLIQFFDEIWVILANSRNANEHLEFRMLTEMYRVKTSEETEMNLDDEIITTLRKQLETCDDDLEWAEASAVRVFGGRYTTSS